MPAKLRKSRSRNVTKSNKACVKTIKKERHLRVRVRLKKGKRIRIKRNAENLLNQYLINIK